jgi:hypothetical protein
LFNLTQNLRFPACQGKSYYKKAEEHKLNFGDTDLVIEDNFRKVTSRLRRPPEHHAFTGDGEKEDGGSHYYFGSEVAQKSQVKSVIPGEESFSPTIVEVWTLESEAGGR